MLIKTEREDMWHRILWILDEIKDKVNISKQMTIPKAEVQQTLNKIIAKSQNNEIKRLSESLLSYLN